MNKIQDNSRFIDITLISGDIRSLCKDYIRSITEDINSIFLGMSDNGGISMNYWEYATINDPTEPYPTIEAFSLDVNAILNNSAASFTFYPSLTLNILEQNDATSLDYSFSGAPDGVMYYVAVNSGDAVPTISEVINGTGSGGSVAVASGNSVIISTTTLINISGLVAATAYDLYSVTTNSVGDKVSTILNNLTQTTTA